MKFVSDLQARWRALGNMQFVGYLYKHRLIAEKIMHECIRTLLEDVCLPTIYFPVDFTDRSWQLLTLHLKCMTFVHEGSKSQKKL